jgi:3-methylfumaryl-CoA hydratase
MPADSAIGRTQVAHCVIDPARADALCVALGMERVAVGDPLPPFFHQIYFWDAQPAQALGRDGHPAVGGFIPDLGLPRRMWAGGEVTMHAGFVAGVEAEKRSEIIDITRKNGRSGPLGFVRLRHEIWQGATLCVTEYQDLVYREEADPTAPQPASMPAPHGGDPVAFSSTLLFRYSALTFNGHRIHYDTDYARDVEGYGGLVVHGPLLAQLMMLRAMPFGTFRFRGASALIAGENARIGQDGDRFWVAGGDGRLCMSGERG